MKGREVALIGSFSYRENLIVRSVLHLTLYPRHCNIYICVCVCVLILQLLGVWFNLILQMKFIVEGLN